MTKSRLWRTRAPGELRVPANAFVCLGRREEGLRVQEESSGSAWSEPVLVRQTAKGVSGSGSCCLLSRAP